MKRLLLAATACAALFTVPALADGYYVEGTAAWSPEGDVDVAGVSVDTDAGYLIGGAVGRTFANNFSLEGEVTYSNHDFDGIPAEIDALGFFANAFYNFPVNGPVGAYVGGGLGAVQVGASGFGVSDEEFVFGGQVMGGLTYAVSDGVTLFGEYRYQAAADASLGGVDFGYDSHNVGGGLRLNF